MTTSPNQLMTPYVLPFTSGSATLPYVGGKGANLARLSTANFPVPGGFFLTTEVYSAVVDKNGLRAWIAAQIDAIQTDDPDALSAVSTRIRTRFREITMPPDMADAIRRHYADLGGPPVAVRSSATAEDLPDMSFAGQQDTYLNVLGDTALLEAVRDCWSSLWTARAIGYRSRNGIAHDGVALAVVVQEMVQSDVSGVLFTANPLDGHRDQTVIDATLGLGEALVSGLVEPDHYLVETATGRILEKRLGAKATVIYRTDGGGTHTERVDNAADKQALSDTAIRELVALGKRVADFYGSPQDIEWAYAQDRLYLLQARPITSLYPLPEGKGSEPLGVFFSFGAVQGMLDPITPLGQDMLRGVFAAGASLFGYDFTTETQSLLFVAGGRLFVRITPLLRTAFSRTLITKALSVIEPGTAQALDTILNEPELTLQHQFPSSGTVARIRPMLTQTFKILAKTLARPEAERRQFERRLDLTVAEIREGFSTASTLAERINRFEHILYNTVPLAIPTLMPRVAAGVVMINRWLALTNPLYKTDNGLPNPLEITRGLPHNVTTEMDLMLWTVATVIRKDSAATAQFLNGDPSLLAAQYHAGDLPYIAQAAIAAFLDRYGARGLAEIDLGRERWREDPTQVVQMVQNYLHITDVDRAPAAVFRRGAAAAEKTIEVYVSAAQEQQNGGLKARLIRWTAKRLRTLAGLRESPKFFVIRLMGVIRQAFLDSGEALVATGELDQATDLFFLYLSELKELAAGQKHDCRRLIAQRRADYEREKKRRQVPRLLLSDGRAFYDGMRAISTNGDNGSTLNGSPVSPGVVEGIVHVVFDPNGANLVPGEILVCPGTDPAWTPLFLAAAGLVMEVGGLMTHGSVVAREYGIPAVVGVDRVTERLKNGQRVRVDGSQGLVTILDAEVSPPQ